MILLKLNSKGPDVLFMLALLGLSTTDGEFGLKTEESLKNFLRNNNLEPDGICGPKTWEILLKNRKPSCTDQDIIKLAEKLDIEPAALKAVKNVESGKSPFTPNGRPQILFEGHIFWQLLEKIGINPKIFNRPNILYPKWTKEFYIGGDKEYDRLQEAFNINPKAALLSTSIGMFLIMGFNYTYCGANNIYEYWANSFLSDLNQLEYLGKFITNCGLIKYLKKLDWQGFARTYNGSGQVNYYANKLKESYNKFK